jgi:hypothetical protein
MAELKYNALNAHSGPVLAGFSSSPLPPHFLEGEDALKFKLFTHQDAPRQKILAGENERFSFTGSNFGRNSSKHQNSRYFIGLWDKEEGQLRFTDVDASFTMEQTLKGVNLTANDFSNQTAEQQRNALVESFGTAKSKQRLRAAMGKQLDDKDLDSGLAANIKEKAKELDERPAEPLSVDDYLPPHNIDATEPGDLYPLSGLIPSELMEIIDIKLLQKAFKKRKVFKALETSWEAFPYSLLEKASEFETERLKVLTYLNSLLRICKLDRALKVNKSEQWGVLVANTTQNEVLLKYLLKTFFLEKTEKAGTKYVRSKVLTDKLLTHIIILSFIANDFTLNPDKLGPSLKMTTNKLVTYVKSVGAKRPGRGDFVLKPPLEFPSVIKRQRRR